MPPSARSPPIAATRARSGTTRIWQADGPATCAMRSTARRCRSRTTTSSVSMTRGDAQLALFDQASWDKYGLAKLTNGKFAANSLIVPGAGGAQDLSIPALMKRGVIFLACHNAIWAAAGRAIAGGTAGSQEEVAADLTNHLLPGVILTPGALATLPLMQEAGFHYVT